MYKSYRFTVPVLSVALFALASCNGVQEGHAPRPQPQPEVSTTDSAVEEAARVPPPEPLMAAPLTMEQRAILEPQAPQLGDHPAYQTADYTAVHESPHSTFSMEVDTASYSVVRRYLRQGVMPPADAVRIEEMLNYFDFDYETPASREEGFRPSLSLFEAPWDDRLNLLRIGIKAYAPAPEERPPLNLVLLIDRSGSMSGPDRIGLIRSALPSFVEGLRDDDRVSLIAYANGVEVLAEPTTDHESVANRIETLHAGGSTAGGQALQQAYALAEQSFDPDAENRILLITDGDFNVGISDPAALERFVTGKRDEGIGISILGIGAGNFNDTLVQAVVQSGNGVAAYIDSPTEARRLLRDGAAGLLYTIAGDVKVQVEFNPAHVARYRLLGYETRLLNDEDFLDEEADAGEVNAGRSVTALYEIVTWDALEALEPETRYSGNQESAASRPPTDGVEAEWAQVRIAFKPNGPSDAQQIIRAEVLPDMRSDISVLGPDDALAAAVAAFGGRLRQDPVFDDMTYSEIEGLLEIARQIDPDGWRAELLHLVSAAASLDS